MLGVLVLALGLMTYSYVGQKQLEDEYPATGAFVEVSGVKLHYRVLGDCICPVFPDWSNCALSRS